MASDRNSTVYTVLVLTVHTEVDYIPWNSIYSFTRFLHIPPTVRKFPRALWLHQTLFIHQYRHLHHLIVVFPCSTLRVASLFPLLSRRRLTDGFPSKSRRLHSVLPTIQPCC
jgi:hypothetical protein